ncbi:hypothetical protein [Haloarcula marina]|uniref:hypothetical protein n=1 Tax=Haloarcula marina TaxID=2961574 RepID=UPI0020B806DD|nr:hypothetical protein [Halomicroarcula marina]
MSYDPPTPPAELPAEVVDTLNGSSPETLTRIAQYAEELATHKRREARLEADEANEESPKDRPDGVPSKATVTEKEINGNRYYYWQWRDGEKIRSQYKGPVNDDS